MLEYTSILARCRHTVHRTKLCTIKDPTADARGCAQIRKTAAIVTPNSHQIHTRVVRCRRRAVQLVHSPGGGKECKVSCDNKLLSVDFPLESLTAELKSAASSRGVRSSCCASCILPHRHPHRRRPASPPRIASSHRRTHRGAASRRQQDSREGRLGQVDAEQSQHRKEMGSGGCGEAHKLIASSSQAPRKLRALVGRARSLRGAPIQNREKRSSSMSVP